MVSEFSKGNPLTSLRRTWTPQSSSSSVRGFSSSDGQIGDLLAPPRSVACRDIEFYNSRERGASFFERSKSENFPPSMAGCTTFRLLKNELGKVGRVKFV